MKRLVATGKNGFLFFLLNSQKKSKKKNFFLKIKMSVLLRCPLTNKIFLEPVTLNTGITYEYEAIIEHFKKSIRCPVTNKKIGTISKNLLIKEMCENEASSEKYVKKTSEDYDYCEIFILKHKYSGKFQFLLESNLRIEMGVIFSRMSYGEFIQMYECAKKQNEKEKEKKQKLDKECSINKGYGFVPKENNPASKFFRLF